MSKEITNEELAEMVKVGFDSQDKKFNKVDKILANVENKLDTLEKGQEEIQLRLSNVAYRFEVKELEARISILEDKIIRQGRLK